MNLDPQQQSSQAQFDRNSANYGRQHILARTDDLEAAFAHVPAPAREARALDVATGGGHTALFAARRGWQVTLADLSAAMLENAHRLLQEEGFGAERRQFPAEEFPFADGEFGLVTCRVAAHHFSDPAAFVRETFRVLAPDGTFVLIDGSLPDDRPDVDAWMNAVEKWRDPSHGRLISRKEWTQMAEAAGFEVVSAELKPFLQPDLEWYFETARTSPENRQKVLDAITAISPEVRKSVQLAEMDGKITWVWQRLELVARKPA